MTTAGPANVEVRLAPSAVRDLDTIPPRYAAAVIDFIALVLPPNPRRLGNPLRNELEGLFSARRGDYRVLYQILDADQVILIVRVDHLGRVYGRRRAGRGQP